MKKRQRVATVPAGYPDDPSRFDSANGSERGLRLVEPDLEIAVQQRCLGINPVKLVEGRFYTG